MVKNVNNEQPPLQRSEECKDTILSEVGRFQIDVAASSWSCEIWVV